MTETLRLQSNEPEISVLPGEEKASAVSIVSCHNSAVSYFHCALFGRR